MKSKPKVFVYGTLKTGFPNNIVLNRSGGVFLGIHVIPKEDGYAMLSLGAFPAVTKSETPTEIHGEVWRVSTLAALDMLEGYPHAYNRCLINTPYGEAWMYHGNFGPAPIINSGEWL